jgi:HK97 family phage major capsid protein
MANRIEFVNGVQLRQERRLIEQDMIALTDKLDSREIGRGRYNSEFVKLENELQLLEQRITSADANGWLSEKDRIYRSAPPAGLPGAVGEQQHYSTAVRREDPKHRRAFSNWLRLGAAAMDPAEYKLLHTEHRDMIAGTPLSAAYPGSTAGFFVPVGFVDQINEAVKYYGPMLRGGIGFPRIIDTATGQPLPFPSSNDVQSYGELVGEGQQVTALDVQMSQVLLGSYKFSSRMCKVSMELVQDSAFSLEDFLIDVFAKRLGRTLNQFFTTGTGVNQPRGIVTAVLAGGNTIVAKGSATNDSLGGPNTIGSDDLTNLVHLVDPLHRATGRYMFADSTLRSLKNVKDKYGRPLWLPSTRDGAPETINGFEYAINNDMDQLQTTSSSPPVTRNTVLFGSLDQYVIRRVKDLAVMQLRERFADYGQVAFIGWWRGDGNSLDIANNALGILQNVY